MKRIPAIACFLIYTYTATAASLPSLPDGVSRGWLSAGCICILLYLIGIGYCLRTRRKLKEQQAHNLQLAGQLSTLTGREQALHQQLAEARRELTETQHENIRREQLLQTVLQRLNSLEQAAHQQINHSFLPSETDTPSASAAEESPTEPVSPLTTPEHQSRAKAHPEADMPKSGDAFIDRITMFMLKNIDNAELSIEEFARHHHISRSNLYRQIKAATGLTPVEFMHKVRITRSIELMRNNYTFSQIAYMTGFNDPKYFGKCFKKYTGMTPTEYKEQRLS